MVLSLALLASAGCLAVLVLRRDGLARIRAELARRRAARVMHRAAQVDVAAHAGTATERIVGTVLADGLLVAPLSRRACVGYHVIVERHDTATDAYQKLGWYTLFECRHGIPFRLRDASGVAQVEPSGAALLLRHDATVVADRDRNGWLGTFVAGQGYHLNGGQLRAREAIIAPGSVIAVAGMGVHVPVPATAPGGAPYRSPAATQLAMSASAAAPLIISDHAGV